ncbi:MAG: hypothetical protein JNL58_20625 [Planctomyces sp.]|nr:hypothetical protein [Planctomyces sp.]
MRFKEYLLTGVMFSAGALIAVVAGCSAQSSPSETNAPTDPETTVRSPDAGVTPVNSPETKSEAVVEAEEHPHKPGSHGGIIIPIGSDSYHAEAVIETNGSLRLLMLGKDETRIQEVDVQPVKAYVKVVGDPSTTPIDLVAVPQDGDSADKTSQFVGELPEAFRGKQLDVTIPNLRIAGERFRVGFTTVTEDHSSEMPGSLPVDDERQLYLTAGGKYSEADIKANGSVTASQKFKGIKSMHDAKPKPGDRICPISMTKANPDFTWIIDGKPYQFCCPPCVDEFVKMAKERPEELQDPDTFIKSDVTKP